MDLLNAINSNDEWFIDRVNSHQAVEREEIRRLHLGSINTLFGDRFRLTKINEVEVFTTTKRFLTELEFNRILQTKININLWKYFAYYKGLIVVGPKDMTELVEKLGGMVVGHVPDIQLEPVQLNRLSRHLEELTRTDPIYTYSPGNLTITFQNDVEFLSELFPEQYVRVIEGGIQMLPALVPDLNDWIEEPYPIIPPSPRSAVDRIIEIIYRISGVNTLQRSGNPDIIDTMLGPESLLDEEEFNALDEESSMYLTIKHPLLQRVIDITLLDEYSQQYIRSEDLVKLYFELWSRDPAVQIFYSDEVNKFKLPPDLANISRQYLLDYSNIPEEESKDEE